MSWRAGLAIAAGLLFAACSSVPPVDVADPLPPAAPAPAVAVPPPEDPAIRELRQRVERLTAQLAEAQRRYALLGEEHRKAEAALRDSQKRIEELQQKIEALRAIDRETRRPARVPK
jgi:hypothetical protein